MTRYTDARWGCVIVLLLVGSGFAAGVMFGELVMDPRQQAAREAVTPHEEPTAMHTLRGARTACTSLVERLEGLHVNSIYRAQGGGP